MGKVLMEIGQRFKSKSKVQKEFVEYTYHGVLPNSYHLIKDSDGEPLGWDGIETEWFNQRKIILL